MGTAPHIALDIVAFNNKEVPAYNYAFKFFYPALCDFAARMVGRDTAKDIVEDLFLKIWASPQQFREADHLKAFFYRAIKNACLDFIKVNKRASDRNSLFTNENAVNDTDYLAGIIRAEVLMELYAAIAELPTEKGRIIKMTYLEGKSNQETADELGISVQTVKNQKSRGLAILKDKLPEGMYLLLVLHSIMK